MNKWIAEFELEDGDTMPEHMDLEYKGARIDFHCRPLEQEPTTKSNLGVDCISRQAVIDEMEKRHAKGDCITKGFIKNIPSVTPQEPMVIPIAEVKFDKDKLKELVDKAVFTVTPNIEPRKGHWDKDGACPFCGYFRQWDDDAFCGHCGAQLGEVEE